MPKGIPGGPGRDLTPRTHCPQGHEYTEANTYRYARPGSHIKLCKTCTIERANARRANARVF